MRVVLNIVAFGLLIGGGGALVAAQPQVSSPLDTELEAALIVAAQELNRTLPQKLDPSTTLIRVSTSGLTWTYHYNLTERATPAQVVSFFTANGFVKSCADPDMRSLMSGGVTYSFEYSGPHLAEAVAVDVNDAACIAQGA